MYILLTEASHHSFVGSIEVGALVAGRVGCNMMLWGEGNKFLKHSAVVCSMGQCR